MVHLYHEIIQPQRTIHDVASNDIPVPSIRERAENNWV